MRGQQVSRELTQIFEKIALNILRQGVLRINGANMGTLGINGANLGINGANVGTIGINQGS